MQIPLSFYFLLYTKKSSRRLNCTPFVRQYDILSNKWGDILCQKESRINIIHQNSKNSL